MRMFLVRLAKDRQVVGIFAARDERHLAEFIDECCNATETEYASLPAGGYFISGQTKAVFPPKIDPENPMPNDPNEHPLDGGCFNETWGDKAECATWSPMRWTGLDVLDDHPESVVVGR